MKARSAFSIQKDVLFAIFVREMNARFSGYTFGNVWIVLEPLLMIVMFILIFGLRGRGEFGYVGPPVFVFASFLPFKMLWQFNMKRVMSAAAGSKGLLGFRQVRLFDVFVARGMMEAGLFLVVGLIIATIMWWIGFDPWPGDILGVLAHSSVLWLFSLSFGMLACVVSQVAMEVEKFINMLTMPLLFLSAVFFPMTIVPQPYRDWLAWNPLVHANELIREAWLPVYESPVADFGYLGWWTVVTLALAVSAYRLSWQRIVAT
jgi:capsular polysaccharide transport system permease protein